MQAASETAQDSPVEAAAVMAVAPPHLRLLAARLLAASCLLIGLADGLSLQHCFTIRDEFLAAVKPPAASAAVPAVARAAPPAVVDPAAKITRDLADARPTILDLALIDEETDRLAWMRRTGVDIEKLLRRIDPPSQEEGGPFVAAAAMRTTPFNSRRLSVLQRLFKTMPFGLPLAHFRIDSSFGMRRDPFTNRPAFHTGIDLGGPYSEPVYSTASGKIVYAGRRGAYGRDVDIDHGNGIVTRYAHLSRVLVVCGQRVKAHQEIGRLGSTGRSTGPHLHYEVIVDGRPLNPIRFLLIGAGADVTRLTSFNND
jgi:murein DD-endopeptidase MepM/ murein hydrolase activator NlpD